MFIAGPKIISTPFAWHSFANAFPISSINFLSQELAVVTAVGKQVEGILGPNCFSSGVSGSFLSPCGPSDILIEGIPSLSIGFVRQLSNPEQRLAFSSKVI
jgi:hypothetical protein